MAKASWVKTTPSSGSGDATVNVSSTTVHTGRKARSSVLTFKAANVADVQRTVNQAGKPAYVDIADAASADKNGQAVPILGVSNAQRLTFSLGAGDLEGVLLPDMYDANSLSTYNGENIAGDPGASAEYNFSIVLKVPANRGTQPLTRQIIVTDESGNRDVCLLTLAAGAAYITVAEGDIKLDYLGTEVAVEVKSNTSWTVE